MREERDRGVKKRLKMGGKTEGKRQKTKDRKIKGKREEIEGRDIGGEKTGEGMRKGEGKRRREEPESKIER